MSPDGQSPLNLARMSDIRVGQIVDFPCIDMARKGPVQGANGGGRVAAGVAVGCW